MLKKDVCLSCEKRRKIRTSEKESKKEKAYIQKLSGSVYTLSDSYRDNRKSMIFRKVISP